MTTEQDILQIARDIDRIAEEISACHFGWGNELRDLANRIRSTGPQAVDSGKAAVLAIINAPEGSFAAKWFHQSVNAAYQKGIEDCPCC